MIRTLHRFLRLPTLVIAEIVALALAGTLGAAMPGLDVFRSPFFAALALLAAASLLDVVVDLGRRRHLGSLMLHAGVLLVIAAGAVRGLFGTEAVVDLIEGETLPPAASAWNAQRPGLLAKPFCLEQPVTLEAVRGRRYASGALRDLGARLSVGELALNRRLAVGGGRLFLSQTCGPAALLEWSTATRAAVLLDSATRRGVATGPDGLRVHLWAGSERPDRLAVRVMRGAGLLYAGDLRAGQTLALPGDVTLALHGLPMWVRIHGSRDPSPWLAGCGMTLLLTGAVAIFVFRPHAFGRRTNRLAADPAAVRPAFAWAGGAPLTLALLFASFATSCMRADVDEARRLVLCYNDAVTEAYRRGDVTLVDGIVGPHEGRKLTGLIGVRLDMGLTLDARLLALEVTGVERADGEQRIRTKERWRYCDRRIGTGEQVGEGSTDAYDMLYVFKRIDGAWRVDAIRFDAPPKVGRAAVTWTAAHGGEVQP